MPRSNTGDGIQHATSPSPVSSLKCFRCAGLGKRKEDGEEGYASTCLVCKGTGRIPRVWQKSALFDWLMVNCPANAVVTISSVRAA